MVLVMFWGRDYFVCSLTSFSVNAHGLRHVSDKLAFSIYLLVVLADKTSTTAFGSVYTCPQHKCWVRLP